MGSVSDFFLGFMSEVCLLFIVSFCILVLARYDRPFKNRRLIFHRFAWTKGLRCKFHEAYCQLEFI